MNFRETLGRHLYEGGTSSSSYLTLVFERQGDQWLLVQSQNTPIR